MQIIYREQKDFTEAQLAELFRSVKWKSGEYPKRLAAGLRNSSRVLSAWDGETLVGLVRSLDDGAGTAFIHYLLVRPEYRKYHIGGMLLCRLLLYYQDYLYIKIMPSDKALIPFYEKYGFREYENYCAMEIDRLGELPDELPSAAGQKERDAT